MVLLGIGSNLSSSFGDRFDNINIAVLELNNRGLIVKKQSSYFESFAYPNKDDPKFINIVVQIDTNLSPEKLASVLLFIEKDLERTRGKKNDPRTCDIDIIDYNGKNIKFTYENLVFIVPHKRIAARNFVLIPIKEILPNWMHPKTKKHIDNLLEKLPSAYKNSILKVNKP